MITSWKTSLFGVIGSIALIISQNPSIVHHHPIALMISNLIVAGALAGLGISARANKVSDEQAGAGKK